MDVKEGGHTNLDHPSFPELKLGEARFDCEGWSSFQNDREASWKEITWAGGRTGRFREREGEGEGRGKKTTQSGFCF